MNRRRQRHPGISVVASLVFLAGLGISQAEEASVAGIYSLTAVNGNQLPVNSWTQTLDGERCDQVILRGVLLLDSEGRSAAYLEEQVSCPGDDDPENEGEVRSVIFAGSYTVSGNVITLVDDFGTDQAFVEGNTLIYETGGEGRPVDRFVFRKE